MNDQLEPVYSAALQALRPLLTTASGISAPLLISVPDAYHRATTKLMVVGQQSASWPERHPGAPFEPDGLLGSLLAEYRRFRLGGRVSGSPFWQASHQLYRRLNPVGPECGFLWSNLIKLDQWKSRPGQQVEELVCSLNLLQAELRITRPDVILFFTGPNYDERLRKTFPGLTIEPAPSDRIVGILSHPMLPRRAYRTYHPNYLWRSRRRDVLDAIAELATVA